MKKIILLLLVCFSLFNKAEAQLQTMTASTYSIVNGATGTLTLQVGSDIKSLAIQAVFTKYSGTIGGTATLQGSIDGTHYDVNGVSVNTSSFSLTDVASQNYIWQVDRNLYKYYRISITGTGTMIVEPAGYVLTNPFR